MEWITASLWVGRVAPGTPLAGLGAAQTGCCWSSWVSITVASNDLLLSPEYLVLWAVCRLVLQTVPEL